MGEALDVTQVACQRLTNDNLLFLLGHAALTLGLLHCFGAFRRMLRH
jgi:hypothetical protein